MCTNSGYEIPTLRRLLTMAIMGIEMRYSRMCRMNPGISRPMMVLSIRVPLRMSHRSQPDRSTRIKATRKRNPVSRVKKPGTATLRSLCTRRKKTASTAAVLFFFFASCKLENHLSHVLGPQQTVHNNFRCTECAKYIFTQL